MSLRSVLEDKNCIDEQMLISAVQNQFASMKACWKYSLVYPSAADGTDLKLTLHVIEKLQNKEMNRYAKIKYCGADL